MPAATLNTDEASSLVLGINRPGTVKLLSRVRRARGIDLDYTRRVGDYRYGRPLLQIGRCLDRIPAPYLVSEQQTNSVVSQKSGTVGYRESRPLREIRRDHFVIIHRDNQWIGCACGFSTPADERLSGFRHSRQSHALAGAVSVGLRR